MLAAIGLVTVLVAVVLLVSGRLSPLVTFVVVPLLGACAAGVNLAQMQKLVASGMATVSPIVALFIFAILFFSIMNEQGLFEPLIRSLLKIAGDHPYRVLMVTVLVAAMVHLDGAGATTYVVTITALLPIYKRLNIDVRHLPLLAGMSAGIMNMEPWTPATLRAASALHVDPVTLWHPLWSVQLAGLGFALALAWWLGHRVKPLPTGAAALASDAPAPAEKAPLVVPTWRRVANGVLTVAVIAAMLFSGISTVLVLMVGVAIALPLNYKGASAQMATVRRHSGEALLLSAVLLSAGVFLGVLNGSGMLDAVAKEIVAIIPVSYGHVVHIIVGAFATPLGMMFGSDSYYFGIMPVLVSVGQAHGVTPDAVARALMIGENVGFAISPVVGSAYLAAGLAGVEFGAHIRHSLLYTWGVALAMLGVAVLVGAV